MYNDFSFNPIYKLDSTVWGVMGIMTDSTQKVLNEGRLKTLNKLSCHIAEEFIHEKLKRHIPDYFPKTHEIIDLIKTSDKDYDTYIEVKYATSTYSFLKCDCWPINLVIKEEKPIHVLLKDNSQAILLPIKLTFVTEIYKLY
ncbi:hypothetical protein C2G38_2183815 [Gigaspora rosea]|uniref:Uncharacterized protein n=1 Tax=Gigaspora rosea TaxID=44941 RepID=A0A397V8I4_9GLOM|nr:hypothetical protein C2G38_2183815 [Gigaspora rosea]